MSIHLNKQMNWKEKRVKAINKVISKSIDKKETTEDYVPEYNRICVSKAVNKKEYKGENNGNS